MSSMISVAQNVTSVLRGANSNQVESDSLAVKEEPGFDFTDDSIPNTASPSILDIPIEPIRTNPAMLGQGELSLASLGLNPETDLPERQNSLNSSDPPALNSEVLNDPPYDNALLVPSEGPKLRSRRSFDAWKRPKKSFSRSSLSTKRALDKSLTMPVASTQAPRPGIPRIVTSPQGPTNLPTSTSTTFVIESDEDRPKPGDGADASVHLVGMAYATKKRNQDFHKLFRSLQVKDFLLDDFSCALSREILIQGRMYVSERNICFNSNILGWVTNLIIPFGEIVGLEKKTTAGLFPNGIVVQTLHARHSFASFISRDLVFELVMNVWRQTNVRTDLASYPEQDLQLGAGFDDSDKNDDDIGEDNSSLLETEFDESDDYDDASSLDDYNSDLEMSTDEEFGESARTKKAVETTPAVTSQAPVASSPSQATAPLADGASPAKWPVSNLGPETHAPTDPGFDYEGAGEKLLINEVVAAPLGVVVNLLFGDDTKWISNFITEKEKNVDLKPMSGFDGGLSAGKKRAYEYVKPLSGPVGPKQTRCLCTDTIDTWNLESHATVITSTQTPDVPSGGSFLTKTRYTISWAENNSTRILLTYVIEWSGKSWFKSPIEKGTHDGQIGFSKNLISELNATFKKAGASTKQASKSTVAVASGAGKKTKNGGKRKRKSSKSASNRGKVDVVNSGLSEEGFLATLVKAKDMLASSVWGLLLAGMVLYWLLSTLFLTPVMRGSGLSSSEDYYRRDAGGFGSKERLDMIRLEEEYNVWQWIGDRTDFTDSFQGPGTGGGGGLGAASVAHTFNKALYNEQELKEAIKLTELRVQELKMALNL